MSLVISNCNLWDTFIIEVLYVYHVNALGTGQNRPQLADNILRCISRNYDDLILIQISLFFFPNVSTDNQL